MGTFTNGFDWKACLEETGKQTSRHGEMPRGFKAHDILTLRKKYKLRTVGQFMHWAYKKYVDEGDFVYFNYCFLDKKDAEVFKKIDDMTQMTPEELDAEYGLVHRFN